jgi:phosphatidate cytidylyltransferase
MSPHVKRWITALIAVPILFVIIAYGGQELFAALIIVASLVGMYEYNRMAFGKGLSTEKTVTMTSAVLILLSALSGDRSMLLSLLTFSVMVVLMLNLRRGNLAASGDMMPHRVPTMMPNRVPGGLDMAPAGRALLGILYIPVLMSHFILIRKTQSGVLWIFFILVLAFAGDVAAYYVGRRFGKRKLLPEVSPGKTVEGTIGLIAGSVVGCLLFRQWFFPMLTMTHAAILGLVGSVIGQLGDLSESALKRAAGVKDSGVILPGHGGILDRLDCLMFIAPFVFYYQEFVIR